MWEAGEHFAEADHIGSDAAAEGDYSEEQKPAERVLFVLGRMETKLEIAAFFKESAVACSN